MILSRLEHLIRRGVNSVGLDLHRYKLENSHIGRLVTMLARNKINLVFDVGANIGQFAQSLRRAGYTGHIVSFEPLSSAHSILFRASRKDSLWKIAPRVAIGEGDGEIDIHISANSVSSSALPMLDDHVKAELNSAYVGVERARLARLDTLTRDYLWPEAISFLKIDTQGYEDRVLNGASEFLPRVRGVQLELSLVPLYEGQKLFDFLFEHLVSLGFSIWAIWPGFCDPHTGRMLQVDATFFRE